MLTDCKQGNDAEDVEQMKDDGFCHCGRCKASRNYTSEYMGHFWYWQKVIFKISPCVLFW